MINGMPGIAIHALKAQGCTPDMNPKGYRQDFISFQLANFW